MRAENAGRVGRYLVEVYTDAAYATSEVVIIPGRIESWDRGFDADGNQVWGAASGPYVFIWDEGPFD